MTALATTPQFPVPKRDFSIVVPAISAGGVTSTFFRAWLTAAPTSSTWYKKLQQSNAARVLWLEGDTGHGVVWNADAGGVFVATVQHYTRGIARPGYQGAPVSQVTEVKVGTELPYELLVGQRLDQKVGPGSDTATLRLWTWDATIRATQSDVHGETTPALVAPSSSKSAFAAHDSSVTSILSLLANMTVANALGTMSGIINDILPKFNAHLTQAGVHHNNDADNAVGLTFFNPTSPEAVAKSISEIARLLDRHMRNDKGNGTGSQSASPYHKSGVNPAADWNVPLLRNAGDMLGAMGVIGATWEAYEAHRTSAVHLASDSTNVLTALNNIPQVHARFLAVLRKLSFTPPPTINSGAALLLQHGFTEST